MSTEVETLRFDDLEPYLLLKNGNFLYRVPFRDDWAVLKVYYGSRGFWGRLRKSFANVVLSDQTSYQPRTRCRVEYETAKIWRKHGFRVFDIYDDVKVEAPSCVPGGYRLFEYVEAPKLLDILQDESRPEDERFELYRRWLPEWSRRHDLAISEREPRLVHENGDGGHVMILEDGSFLWFDFEMVFRTPGNVARHVSHEIIQYLWDTHKNIPENVRERLFHETIEHYPDRDRLYRTYDYFYRHPNPIERGARALDRRFRQRAQKPTSKYKVAQKLRDLLDQ